MANKAISELPQAENVNNQDLFVLEQGGLAKKLTAETFITEQGIINALAEALDGHGGIQSVTLQSLSGRVRTYLITFSDGSATTFQVLDGSTITNIQKTSTAGLVDTYTIYMSDGTTSFFQVRNGQDGSATWDQINGKAPVITETTESSAIANFLDGADDMPVTSLVADIEPKQDLTYGDPYPAGGGVNLLDPSTLTSYGTSFGLTSSISGDVITLSGTYTGSTTNPSFRTLVVPTHENWSFSAFEITTTGTINKLRWNNNSSTSIVIDMQNMTPNAQYSIKFKLVAYESGTPAPGSYAPYENICPITGWTGVNVYHESAYDPTANPVISLSWQTEAGTVYGGTIDVTTGLLTVTDANIASYAGETLPSTWISDRDVYAQGTTPTTGAQVVYKLATSQTYQLTPQQLMTLYGTNNVWADTGDVTVKYPADTKMYIDNAIAALA